MLCRQERFFKGLLGSKQYCHEAAPCGADDRLLCGSADIAHEHVYVAGVVCAVFVSFGFLCAEVTVAYDFTIALEVHHDAFIKGVERAEEIFAWIFFHVSMDTFFELVDVFEALAQEIRGHFFAANAACADGNDLFVFVGLEFYDSFFEVA